MKAAVALEKDSVPTSATGLVCKSEAGKLRSGVLLKTGSVNRFG